jgi:DNA polymerase III subunit gamma/tau
VSNVIYRKYRSKTFSDLLGQNDLVSIIRESIKTKRIANAYLFTGPRGTGKTSTARIFAKAINCSNFLEKLEPCNECQSCIKINNNSSLDIIEIDAASNRGIDEIRDLKEKVNFLPVELTYKIYIIDEAHMLTIEAFNALLKTLEEPPSNVIFILATTEVNKIPITILSRVQRFDFNLAEVNIIVHKLNNILKNEGIDFESESLEIIANYANGSFRDAETILEKLISFKENNIITVSQTQKMLGYAESDFVDKICYGIINDSRNEVLGLLKKLENKGVNLSILNKQLLEKSRLLLLDSIQKNNNITKIMSTFISELININQKINLIPLPILLFEIMVIKLTTDKLVDQNQKNQDDNSVFIENKLMLNKSNLETNWGLIVKNISKISPHLAAFLSQAVIKNVDKGIIYLEVKFEFHKKKIMSEESYKLLFKEIEGLYGNDIKSIKCILNNIKIEYNEDKINEDDTNKILVESIFN